MSNKNNKPGLVGNEFLPDIVKKRFCIASLSTGKPCLKPGDVLCKFHEKRIEKGCEVELYNGSCLSEGCRHPATLHGLCGVHVRRILPVLTSSIELSSSRPIDLSIDWVRKRGKLNDINGCSHILYQDYLRRGGVPGWLQLWGIRMIFGGKMISELYEYTSSFLFPLPHDYYLADYQKYRPFPINMEGLRIKTEGDEYKDYYCDLMYDFNVTLPKYLEIYGNNHYKTPRISYFYWDQSRELRELHSTSIEIEKLYQDIKGQYFPSLYTRFYLLSHSFYIYSLATLMMKLNKSEPPLISRSTANTTLTISIDLAIFENE